MEKCHVCGAELPPQARFCSRCGSAQEEMTSPDELTQISNPHIERSPPTLDPEATFIENTQTPLPQAMLNPGVDEQLNGSFTAQGTFSGNLTLMDFPRTDFSCTTGPFSSFSFFLYGGSGSWTGTVSTS